MDPCPTHGTMYSKECLRCWEWVYFVCCERIGTLETQAKEAKAEIERLQPTPGKTTDASIILKIKDLELTLDEELRRIAALEEGLRAKDMIIAEEQALRMSVEEQNTALRGENERLRQGQCSTPGCENKGHRYLCESCIDALRNLSAEAATLREELDRAKADMETMRAWDRYNDVKKTMEEWEE